MFKYIHNHFESLAYRVCNQLDKQTQPNRNKFNWRFAQDEKRERERYQKWRKKGKKQSLTFNNCCRVVRLKGNQTHLAGASALR